MKKKEKIRKLKKKNLKKKTKKKKSLWITVVIHSILCVGNSKSPTQFSILVNCAQLPSSGRLG
jgi:hypothetical protein